MLQQLWPVSHREKAGGYKVHAGLGSMEYRFELDLLTAAQADE